MADLDLIKDEQRAGLTRQLAQCLKVAGLRRDHTAITHDGFGDDGGHVGSMVV